MECTDACGCDPKLFKNRAVTDGRHKVLGEQMREQEMFGMDQHTHIEKPKSHLISALLLPAINRAPALTQQVRPDGEGEAHETEAQFMLTDVLRAMLFEAEQRKAEGRLLCKVLNFVLQLMLHMGADQLRNGLSGIERSKRKLKWDALEVRSADFLRQYAQNELSLTGEDMICR